MRNRTGTSHMHLDLGTKQQIDQCLTLVQEVLGSDLLGLYLYGSSVASQLEKYSDIDLLVISNRPTTHTEKANLAAALLTISGIYMQSTERPIELTIVNKSDVNPWHYPPTFDFQYGEWLRPEFEAGNSNPWTTKKMPDLALLITQVLLASNTLMGPHPDQLLCTVPHKDFITAIKDELPDLVTNIHSDTRNILLTLARIWCTTTTDEIRSKPAVADWALNHLPEKYHRAIARAKSICIGKEKEYWDDMHTLIEPCVNFMLNKIDSTIKGIMLSDDLHRSIRIIQPPK